jgi:hypothetical protein
MPEERKRDEFGDSDIDELLTEIIDFIDFNTFNKIINKLTDYAEILSEGKISGLINFNFRLNSNQTNKVLKILESIQALTRIYNMALKGSKDLEMEYVSCIFSDYNNPEGISSYLNLKNIIENRLTHQVQQYNINMGKNNTTLAIPLNELRGHVKTFVDLSGTEMTISTKAQHGIIAASLHDAYTTLLNKQEFYNDKTYMKFFFNEDDPSKKKILLLKKERRLTMKEIGTRVAETLEKLQAIMYSRTQTTRESSQADSLTSSEYATRGSRADTFTDRMMLTPFGRQYGALIEKIISAIFDPTRRDSVLSLSEEMMREKVAVLYQAFKLRSDLSKHGAELDQSIEYLLNQDYGIKTFAEKFLYFDRKEPFSKFYSGQNQEQIELFLNHIFTAFFDSRFSNLFKIIKSMDMKKFACAFIIKRIYLREGEALTNFGFFFIRVIARSGGIKSQ